MEARARGTAIHAAFERFAREHPGELPADGAEDRSRGVLLQALARRRHAARPAGPRARRWPRNVAPWVVELERAPPRRRAGC